MKKLSLILALLLTVVLLTGCRNTETITEEKAKSIALEHAGITAQQAEHLVVRKDFDDGRQIFEVHFHYNGHEYEYEINAQNGSILEFDKDRD